MSSQIADPAALANVKPGEASHAQPVGAVVPVLVQGSRQGADQRLQPFVEESKTVVVFQNGAVLRISEGVGPGQLLILKNLKSNREVACRIVKANDKMKGYFEIEFTQPETGFWGVDFPATASTTSPAVPAEHHAQVSAKSEPELKPATAADLAASTEELMEDLDRALASAFASLPKTPMKMPGAPKNGDGGTSRVSSPASSIPANTFAIGDSTNGAGWGSVASPATQPRQSSALPPGSSYTDSKKSRSGDPGLATMADFVATDSLHQSPSLGAPRFETSVAPPRANWMWVVGGVAASAVLLAVGTGIYRHYNHDRPEDLLPPVTSSAPAISQSPQGATPGAVSAESSTGQMAQQTNAISPGDAASTEKNSPANRQGNPAGVPVENSGTVVTATTSRRAAILDTKIKAPASPANGAVSASADPSSIQVPASHGTSNEGALGSLMSGNGSPAAPPAPAPARISSIVQAKLLTSVPPTYPQIAATQSIQGDVKLDLSVSEAGRVTEAKVLSGPPLLRDAAAEAAKQWRYAPGKLDGTAVATHVIVTVHFELKQ